MLHDTIFCLRKFALRLPWVQINCLLARHLSLWDSPSPLTNGQGFGGCPERKCAMPRLTLLLLTLALLVSNTPPGYSALRFTVGLLSSDSGWEMDPNGSTSPEPSPDSGWAMDPDG